MKIIFLITALLTVSALGSTSIEHKEGGIEGISTYGIKTIINELIKSLKAALPDIITLQPVNIELPENKYINGKLLVNKGGIKGVKEFIPDIKYNIVSIPTGFTITLESISVYLEYLVDLVLLDIPLLSIFGQGPVRVEMSNFTINGQIAHTLLPITLSINSMHIHLDDAQFTIEGLLNNTFFSNLVSSVLDDSVGKIINENEGAISSALEDAANALISTVLNNLLKPTERDNQIFMDSDGETEEEVIKQAFETLIEAVKSIIT